MLKTVPVQTTVDTLINLAPEYVTSPLSIRLNLNDDWKEEDVVPNAFFTDDGVFAATKETITSLAWKAGISEPILTTSSTTPLVTIINEQLELLPDKKKPMLLVDSAKVALSLVKSSGHLPMLAGTAVEKMQESILLHFGENCLVESLPLDYDIDVSNVKLVIKDLSVSIKSEEWFGGIGLTLSNSGSILPDIFLFMVRASDGLVTVFPELDSKFSIQKYGGTTEGATDWLDDSVGMASAMLKAAMVKVVKESQHKVLADLPQIIKEVLSSVSLPSVLREQVVTNVVEAEECDTIYDVIVAVGLSQFVDEVSINNRLRSQRASGRVLGVLGARCNECHQLVH